MRAPCWRTSWLRSNMWISNMLTVFTDFKGAYDRVWKAKFISKLKIYGVTGRMLNWYTRFLTQRWVNIQGEDTKSSFKQSKLPSRSHLQYNPLQCIHCWLLEKLEWIKVSMFANIMIWTSASNKNKNQKRIKKQIGLIRIP